MHKCISAFQDKNTNRLPEHDSRWHENGPITSFPETHSSHTHIEHWHILAKAFAWLQSSSQTQTGTKCNRWLLIEMMATYLLYGWKSNEKTKRPLEQQLWLCKSVRRPQAETDSDINTVHLHILCPLWMWFLPSLMNWSLSGRRPTVLCVGKHALNCSWWNPWKEIEEMRKTNVWGGGAYSLFPLGVTQEPLRWLFAGVDCQSWKINICQQSNRSVTLTYPVRTESAASPWQFFFFNLVTLQGFWL